jgi:thiamine biosynthesis lipoprotein ApbE
MAAARIRRQDTTAAAPVLGQLDLKGIAKGFAVDLAMTILRQHGLHHALVEIGGELAGSGIKPDGTPWWVSVDQGRLGFLPATTPLLVALLGVAIATSGCESVSFTKGVVFTHHRSAQRDADRQRHGIGHCAAPFLHGSRRLCHGAHGDGGPSRNGFRATT